MLKEKIWRDWCLGGKILERRSSGGRSSIIPLPGVDGSGMTLRASSESTP
jgi:hypothetical protein